MATKGSFRWIVIFLLFYITVINYIDRSAIAFAIGDIKVDLGLATTEIGLILGAFGLGYAVKRPPGRLHSLAVGPGPQRGERLLRSNAVSNNE